MSAPSEMFALLQKHDGFSGTSEGPHVGQLDLYLEAATIRVPELKGGQVLIQMRMASINPSDLHFIKGEYGTPRTKGAPAGFEGVGDVVSGAGSQAEALIGKRVAFTVDPSGSGTWSQYAVAAAATCIPVRDEMRDEDAAALIVNPLTAMAMFDIVQSAGTSSFLMTAANSQLCKLMTALGRDHDIAPIAVIRSDEQAPHILELGAKHVINSTAADFAEQLKQIIKAEKPRVMLDAVANQTSADIFTAMPNQARWIVYGKLDPTPPLLKEMGQFVFMQKQIEGFWLTRWFMNTAPADQVRVIGEVQERFIAGSWRTEVDETVRLTDAMSDLSGALHMAKGKVMLIP